MSSCLEYWSIQRKSGQLFAEIVTPNGQSLFDWLTPIGGSAAVAAQVRQWLMQWGMDLKLFADDRDARNESSYRPDGIPEGWVLDASASLRFARDIWRALEPAPNSRFDEIDRHILRLSLESAFKAQTGIDAAADFQKFSQFISPVLDLQVMSEEVRRAWQGFLSRHVAPGDAEVFTYSRQSPDILETSHFAIISRATLLLRLASGATAKLFRDAGINGQLIEFWWQRLGQSRGLWEGTREMGDLIDLWADIDLLLTSIDVFQDNHAPGNQTFFLAGKQLQQAFIGLGSCERVAIWSSVT